MGHSHGFKWNDEEIKKALLTCVDGLSLDRMPSKSEVESFFGDSRLSSTISRVPNGWRKWGERLGLDIKKSETATGYEFEEFAEARLAANGFKVERMTAKEHFDLMIDEVVRVDVKVGRRWRKDSFQANSFGINKRNATCDIYMMFALDDNGFAERTFIVPACSVHSSTITVGKESSYNKWIDRFDIVKEYSVFLSKMKAGTR